MNRESFFERLASEKADLREAARRRRIKSGGPDWLPEDLTVGELREALRAQQK